MEAEKSTPEEGMTETPSTTAVLFPDMVAQPPAEPAPPETPPQEVQQGAATPEPEKKEEAPITETRRPPAMDQLIPIKVDGVEMELPLREIIKGYQTDQHLSRKGQRIAEEKARLQQAVTPKPSPVPPEPMGNDPLYEVVKPYLAPLQTELAEAKQVISSLKTVAAPLQYQQNLKALDMDLKARGLTDFQEYVPRIEAELSGMSEEDRQIYDTRQGFETLYLRLKVQEKPKPTRESRPVPNVPPQVQTGSAPSNIDDSSMTDKKLFEQAQRTGNVRDWAKLFEFRDKPPGG